MYQNENNIQKAVICIVLTQEMTLIQSHPQSLHEVICFKGMHIYLSSSVPLSLRLLRLLSSPALDLITLEVITLCHMYVRYFHCHLSRQCMHYLW